MSVNTEELVFYAAKSLLEEVALTPKPGLVDILNNGSHKDMNYSLFLKSIDSLRSYFNKIKRYMENISKEEKIFLDGELVILGIEAERDMKKATGGINTHRGAIFNLGIFLATALYIRNNYDALTEDRYERLFRKVVTENASFYFNKIYKEFKGTRPGKRVKDELGVNTIVQEAIAGYPSIFVNALPVYKENLKKETRDIAQLKSLITIMSVLDDSNLYYRGGKDGAKFVKDTSRYIINEKYENNKDFIQVLKQFDQECIRRNLSPGGAADLLSCLIFYYYTVDNEEE